MIRLQCYDCLMETSDQIRSLVNGITEKETRETFLNFLEEHSKVNPKPQIHCLTCEVNYEYEKNEEGKWVEKMI